MPVIEVSSNDQYVIATGDTGILELYAVLPVGLFPPFPQVELPGGVGGLVARGGFAQQFFFASEVLGLTLQTSSGEVIRAGGRVVKNVQGYDLVRPVVGSFGTLGSILEVTLRLRPGRSSAVQYKPGRLEDAPVKARFAWQFEDQVYIMHFGAARGVEQIMLKFAGTQVLELLNYLAHFPYGIGVGDGPLRDPRLVWANGDAKPAMPEFFTHIQQVL